MVQGLIEFVILVGGFAGFGVVIDTVIGEKQRHNLSWYIFGFSNVDIVTFESSVIRGLISPFIIDDRIAWRYVVVWSLVVTGIFGWASQDIQFFDWIIPAYSFGKLSGVLDFAIGTTIVGLVTSFVDYLSFLVTKRLFWDRKPSFPKSILYVLCDISISSLVYLFWCGTIAAIYSGFGLHPLNSGADLLLFALFAGLTSAVAISFFHVFAILVGVTLRLTLRGLRVNRGIALNSDMHEHPFVFLGIVFGVALYVLQRWAVSIP